MELAKENHTQLAILHIPIDSERGKTYIPERGNWASTLHTTGPLLSVPSAVLFQNMSNAEIENFYRDQHFNSNGSLLFSRSIVPALLNAYNMGGKP
jgi:hypothetical protein